VADSDTECTLFESGHILGAVGAKFEHRGRSVFYSGDVHFEDQTIVRGAEFPERDIDALILECTRGDAERDPEYTRQLEGERMAEAIERCLGRGGSVMIPVFAMGKTQEMITLLYEMQQARKLRTIPFHIGGLSIKMTTIYDRFTKRVRRNHSGMYLLRTPGLISTPRERGQIPTLTNGQIYVVSSGMMSQHTMSNRIARQFIHNPKNLLIAVGYADPASPLAAILESEGGDEIELDPRYDPVKRECEVERFDFSGHAPREQLVDYVAKLKPESTILVHGDKPAVERMKVEIEARVPETTVTIPKPSEEIEIG
jgi:Cft2 family RNA processing exonuclease